MPAGKMPYDGRLSALAACSEGNERQHF